MISPDEDDRTAGVRRVLDECVADWAMHIVAADLGEIEDTDRHGQSRYERALYGRLESLSVKDLAWAVALLLCDLGQAERLADRMLDQFAEVTS